MTGGPTSSRKNTVRTQYQCRYTIHTKRLREQRQTKRARKYDYQNI